LRAGHQTPPPPGDLTSIIFRAGPDWPLIAGRQLTIFVNGLAASGPDDLPGPPVTRQDIETSFTLRAPPGRAEPPPAR
jgi:hypothetical protein